MAMRAGDVLTGVAVLTNPATGETFDIGVMVVCGDGEVTYTAQTIDRSYSETITAPMDECPFFLAMMATVGRVARHDRDPARRHR